MRDDSREESRLDHLKDAYGKVTGVYQYTSDIKLPGMLIGNQSYRSFL
ncbi:MAG: hypothetical protein WBB69_16095 [Anaerolineales bacterium]